jgi:hypothetical protein
MRSLLLKSSLTFLLIPMFLITGCEEDREGFGIIASYSVGFSRYERYYPNIRGSWLSDNPPTNNTNIFGFVNRVAPCYIEDGRAPARWAVTVSDTLNPPITPCWGQTATGDIKRKKYNSLICAPRLRLPFFNISPETIVALTENNITISGDGISDTYGMPKVYVLDSNGVFIGEATASSCGPGWLSGTLWIPSVPDGEYLLIVSNKTPDGGYEDIGGLNFLIDGEDPPCDPTGQLGSQCVASGGIWDPVNCVCLIP